MMNSYYNEDLPLYGYTKKTSNNKCRYCIFILWGTTLILSFIGGYYIDKKIECGKNFTIFDEFR